jgi:hypothetical protein
VGRSVSSRHHLAGLYREGAEFSICSVRIPVLYRELLRNVPFLLNGQIIVRDDIVTL